jgi:hypothetical protein
VTPRSAAALRPVILDVDEGKVREAGPPTRQVLDNFVRLKASSAEAGARGFARVVALAASAAQ